MNHRPPLTPAQHIARAKDNLTAGADPQWAIAHALVAIAELLAVRQADTYAAGVTAGAQAGAEAAIATVETIGSVVGGGQ